jgi:hypothetical protein
MTQDEEMKDHPTPSNSITPPIQSTLQSKYLAQITSSPNFLFSIFFFSIHRFEGNSIDH